jgi:hypothetical protein
MAIDSALPVRSGMLKLMKASAPLVALVPAASMFTQWTTATPPYPFIRSGPPSDVPIRGACLDGQEIEVAIHAFSTGRKVGGVITLPAEDEAGQSRAAIARALDRKSFAVPNGTATVKYLGGQLLQDPEESQAFHAIANFRVRVMSA